MGSELLVRFIEVATAEPRFEGPPADSKHSLVQTFFESYFVFCTRIRKDNVIFTGIFIFQRACVYEDDADFTMDLNVIRLVFFLWMLSSRVAQAE